MSGLLRESPAEFEALRDTTSERLGVDRGAVEKDYWATEVLRLACSLDHGVDAVMFKGGTSLSKAFQLIERFSEDVDLLVVTTATGNALKRALRKVADQVSTDLGIGYDREAEGRGYLNARFEYPTASPLPFLTSGVLLELGSRGGPAPNEVRTVGSLMSEAAASVDPTALRDFADLTRFEVTVLAPERTLAEKLAFLHHRASTGDVDALRRGARHLYDVALVLRSAEVRHVLADGQMVELMVDIDTRSEAAGCRSRRVQRRASPRAQPSFPVPRFVMHSRPASPNSANSSGETSPPSTTRSKRSVPALTTCNAVPAPDRESQGGRRRCILRSSDRCLDSADQRPHRRVGVCWSASVEDVSHDERKVKNPLEVDPRTRRNPLRCRGFLVREGGLEL